MMYGNIGNHEAFLRRKLEEQQQAVELQQAIELQSRRLMGLQLLDLKSRSSAAAAPTPIGNPFSPKHTAAASPNQSPPDSGKTSCERRTTQTISLVRTTTDAALLMFLALIS
jgi:hypothetical protein